jgi:hypothetical protein
MIQSNRAERPKRLEYCVWVILERPPAVNEFGQKLSSNIHKRRCCIYLHPRCAQARQVQIFDYLRIIDPISEENYCHVVWKLEGLLKEFGARHRCPRNNSGSCMITGTAGVNYNLVTGWHDMDRKAYANI